MTTATDIRNSLAAFLDAEVEASQQGDRIGVLTPAEYPDGDAVTVWISDLNDGRFDVSDLGTADARLEAEGPGQRAVAVPASTICRRLGVSFEGGSIVARTDLVGLSETCWRVAQAASAIAEAITFHQPPSSKVTALVDAIERELRTRDIDVKLDAQLQGASGHTYSPSLFVPEREAVIEPISGEKPWNKASAVYVEFGDLSAVNGYQLVAVIDDRETAIGEDVEGLLGQVANVARWSDRGQWLDALTSRRLL